jgi:hypothetical protein
VRDNHGETVALWLPPASEVVRVSDMLCEGETPWPDACLPPRGADLWNGDNLTTVAILLAGCWRNARGQKQPCYARQIRQISYGALMGMVEAYLAVVVHDAMPIAWEQVGCDGSTCVPDLCECGYWMKDPAAIGHDLEWARHHAGDIANCFGVKPDFHRSNRHYAAALSGLGHPNTAEARFNGLELLGRVVWNNHSHV